MTQKELDRIRDYTTRLLDADSPLRALSDAELGELASLLEQRRQELSALLEQWQHELAVLLERRKREFDALLGGRERELDALPAGQKQELDALLETAHSQYHVPYDVREGTTKARLRI